MTPNSSYRQIKQCITAEEAEYTYYLAEHSADIGTRYGIRVRLCMEGEVFSEESGALFCDEERALAFISFLAEHLVTPVDLAYVIEDTLDF
ncbi:MAG: hypothetical protein IKC72_03965 [Clostridia bacterium]|nr:hypothetical protein [Clostridia bacterium]